MRRDYIDLPAAGAARGTVRVPGSKSISIRVLLLAALADGETTIEGLLASDDTDVMRTALGALGVPIRAVVQDGGGGDASPDAAQSGDRDWIVDGAPAFPNRDADLFVGNSGLSIRTLVAALAFAGGRYRLSGVERMHERPIGDLVDALNAAGARIAYDGAPGYPPLSIAPSTPADAEDGGRSSADASVIGGANGRVNGDVKRDVNAGAKVGGGADASADTEPDARASRTIVVAGHASSQFVTGLLQAAPLLAQDADLVVAVAGALISRPYVDLTMALMARFGVAVVEHAGPRFEIARGARYASPGRIVVEGDASSASYLLAAGLLGGGPVRVDGVGHDALQGDARFVDVLIAMGADVSRDDGGTVVRSPGVASGFRLRAIDGDFNDMPDAAMTVAVLALFASAPCTLRNIGSWRVKETDRLAAMTTELAKFGGTVEHGDDWLRVAPLSNATIARLAERAMRGDGVVIDTYDDHRIAMCFSLACFLDLPLRIRDPDCVAKTFPDYFERFATLIDRSADADLSGRLHRHPFHA